MKTKTRRKAKTKALVCPVPRPKMRAKDRELLTRARDLIREIREVLNGKIEWGHFSGPVYDLLLDINIELDKPT